ncbi:L-sorbosone dehydrogenase [Metarhizium guizhouense ARSEF 977]|uniref:L-sorbosone dehydrogenase n=1 Tax=Metarhizium guizhouense (strain ARSEF 977) TaxID=1276136 RepID=A0A0B4HCF5_METGA|nr:L-sorbosone dehydrogenase [Metarhizium guizhouense ARSEF 977]
MSLQSALVAVWAASATAQFIPSILGSRDGSGCPNTLAVSYPAPVAAKGWTYRLVAKGFKKPRSIVFDDNGGLLVVDAGVGLYRLTVDQDKGETCVVMSSPKTLVNSTELNHGLALSNDGKALYASSSSRVYAWTYDSKAATVSDTNYTVVANMSDTDKTTRTLLMSQRKPGMLVVSRGTVNDQDNKARNPNSGHAQIRAFDVSSQRKGSEPHDFMDGVLLGSGLRNSVGVAEDPATGGIWSVENSVDELARNGRDIHAGNPGEELNYHGVLDDPSTDKDRGGNYGFPMCYALWNTTGFPDLGGLKPGDQFPGPDAETFTDATCTKDYVAPRLALQAHAAPLDIKFTKDGAKAFISFHGSWATKNPVGYRISSVAFDTSKGEPSAQKSSTDAAVDVLSTPDLAKCPDACFRPVGLAWDSQGRLWFSSDSTGEIFVLHQNGTSSGGGGSTGSPSLVADKAAAWAVVLAAIVAGLFLA